MTAHKHAALMLQYAQDAAETNTPWERWEYSDTATLNQHGEKIRDDWFDCRDNPDWRPNAKYRRKPKTIKVTVNGKEMEFPEPIRDTPTEGEFVYYVTEGYKLSDPPYVIKDACFELGTKAEWFFVHRLMHLSGVAAQAHAAVLNAVCRGDIT